MPDSVQMNFQLLSMIAVLFAGGAAAIALAGRVPRRRDVSELWRLYGTEFAIVGLIALAAVDRRVLLAALLLIGARGQFELRDLLGAALPRWFFGIDAIVAAVVIAGVYLADRLWESAATAAAVAAIAGSVLAEPGSRVRAAAAVAAGVLFPVLPVAVIALLGRLPDGLAWLLFVFIVVETNDSFALLFGKLLGRHRVLPKLSPGKTVEGTLGGALSGAVVGMVLATAVFGLAAGQAVACVGVVLAAGILGDLFTSAVKRTAGRKDFAPVHVLHGGALDIYDSLIVAAPCFFAYYSLFLH